MNIAQTIFLKVKNVLEQQAQEVLDSTQHYYKHKQQTQTSPEIQQYVDIVKLKATGQNRSLDQFNPTIIIVTL